MSSYFIVANMDNNEPEWNVDEPDVSRETKDAYGRPLVDVFAEEDAHESTSSSVTSEPENNHDAPAVFHAESNVQDEIDSATAAEILNVKLNNLRQLVFKKQLVPTRKVGTKLFYSRQSVEALKEARRGGKSSR